MTVEGAPSREDRDALYELGCDLGGDLGESLNRLVEHFGRLQNANRTNGLPTSGVSQNTAVGMPTTPAAWGRSRAKASPSSRPRARTSAWMK